MSKINIDELNIDELAELYVAVLQRMKEVRKASASSPHPSRSPKKLSADKNLLGYRDSKLGKFF